MLIFDAAVRTEALAPVRSTDLIGVSVLLLMLLRFLRANPRNDINGCHRKYDGESKAKAHIQQCLMRPSLDEAKVGNNLLRRAFLPASQNTLRETDNSIQRVQVWQPRCQNQEN